MVTQKCATSVFIEENNKSISLLWTEWRHSVCRFLPQVICWTRGLSRQDINLRSLQTGCLLTNKIDAAIQANLSFRRSLISFVRSEQQQQVVTFVLTAAPLSFHGEIETKTTNRKRRRKRQYFTKFCQQSSHCSNQRKRERVKVSTIEVRVWWWRTRLELFTLTRQAAQVHAAHTR